MRALILDDDDLLLPNAVERLSAALDAAPDARLAYGNVRVDDGRPGSQLFYAFEYSELWLTRRNLFPPHAALFDLALVREQGIRFDESLNWFEDWDFWLSVARWTRFLHVPELTAVYRFFLSQSGVLDPGAPGADPRIREHGDRVAQRAWRRRTLLEQQHQALKEEARRLETAGRWPEAAAAWSAAHTNFHYDAEPVVRYAAIAAAAGDTATARSTLAVGHHLMPDEASINEALADLGRATATGAEPVDR
jgi:hypothetical protein